MRNPTTSALMACVICVMANTRADRDAGSRPEVVWLASRLVDQALRAFGRRLATGAAAIKEDLGFPDSNGLVRLLARRSENPGPPRNWDWGPSTHDPVLWTP